MKNDGKASEDIFVEALEKYGKSVFVERLTDTKAIKGANKMGIVKRTPSDYIVTASLPAELQVALFGGARMFYAEVKSSQDPTSFGFSQFTKGQNTAMLKQKAAGGVYLIFIHRLPTDQWYRLSGEEVLAVKAGGRKSIKWEDMKRWPM